MCNKPIGIFDSGSGGLTTLNECRRLLPNENFIYLADNKNAPYGNKTQSQITGRAFACSNALIGKGAKAVVVACNTATNAAISSLRESLAVPVVGLEPALKPAISARTYGKVLLLCTDATAKSEKLQKLLEKTGDKNVIAAPQKTLAADIEKNIENIESLRGVISEILSNYSDVECIVLGCSHYVYVKELINDFYYGNIKIFDGNVGAAKRLEDVLQANNLLAKRKCKGRVKYIKL